MTCGALTWSSLSFTWHRPCWSLGKVPFVNVWCRNNEDNLRVTNNVVARPAQSLCLLGKVRTEWNAHHNVKSSFFIYLAVPKKERREDHKYMQENGLIQSKWNAEDGRASYVEGKELRYIWNKTLNIDATWERKFDACGGFSGDPRFPKKNLSFAHAPYRRPGRKEGLGKGV